MSTGNCFGDAGLGLTPYGPFQSNLVFRGNFVTGYVNLRQPHIVKCQIEGRNLVLHSSKYGTMQIDSLTKLGEVSYAEDLTCITDMFLLNKVCSLAILMQCTCGLGKILIEVL
jgi:hypothetical protein